MTTKIDVRFSLVNNDSISGFLPQRAEDLSTGYDVKNCGPDIILNPFEHALIPLGFKAFIPEGWWLFLVPRSSTHAKKQMHTLYGVIDESYEGEWFFSAQYIPKTNEIDTKYIEYDLREERGYYNDVKLVPHSTASVYDIDNLPPLKIMHGDAVAQIIVMPRYEMNVIEVTSKEYKELTTKRGALRGAGGFGSSDEK